jgi:hypothetical protein
MMRGISALVASPTLRIARALGQDGQDQRSLGDDLAFSRFSACYFGALHHPLICSQAARLDGFADSVVKLGESAIHAPDLKSNAAAGLKEAFAQDARYGLVRRTILVQAFMYLAETRVAAGRHDSDLAVRDGRTKIDEDRVRLEHASGFV